MKHLKLITAFTCLLLLCAILCNLVSCTVKANAEDLMADVEATSVEGREADDRFVASQMELALKLFRSSASYSKYKNVLVSPLSIQLALAMTANGADGQTREEMQALLGGDIPLEQLNEYLYSYTKSLPSYDKNKLSIANSIWFNNDDSFEVFDEFLQTNANYYNASAYKAPFDESTLTDINNWVKTHTDGMIEKIIDQIEPRTVMYLINAIAFDAEWETKYEKKDVRSGTFTSLDGKKQTVEMMHSEEKQFFKLENAQGFKKDYKDGTYSFVAVLPNEDVEFSHFIDTLDAQKLLSAVKGSKKATVRVSIPKFTNEYEIELSDTLKALGMPSAFSGGFSRLGKSARGELFIDMVLHKTFISVEENGTKASAVTIVGVKDAASPEMNVINLNRPFLYMIVDNSTSLPVFIGTVTEINN